MNQRNFIFQIEEEFCLFGMRMNNFLVIVPYDFSIRTEAHKQTECLHSFPEIRTKSECSHFSRSIKFHKNENVREI